MFLDPIKHVLQVFKTTSKTFHKKREPLDSEQYGSNCERRILEYQKNKLCLIRILYTKNTNEECFIRIY